MRNEVDTHATVVKQVHEIKASEQTTCCIVGGGPAGAILALLLARKGIPVTLLEAHMDFEREFRGDTIHPAVMEILDEIGLAERLLQFRHSELSKFVLNTASGKLTLADIAHVKTKFPYVMVVAQSRFLEFITAEAQRYPTFRLVFGAQVDELIEENGVVRGVRYRGQDGWYEMRADLTVGADGRFSRVRKLAGFETIKTSSPMDILWFRMPRYEHDQIDALGGRFDKGALVPLIDRFDYWQVGYVIPKGGYQKLREAGLESFRKSLVKIVPEFADRVQELRDWHQISVLSIESSRLPRWYRPGLLFIGDSAHVMSPIGGVGINYAIQDAVVAANLLGEKLRSGTVSTRDLAKVQREREIPTRFIQRVQVLLQDLLLIKALRSTSSFRTPWLLRFMLRVPFVRSLPARILAFGLWPAHVKDA